MPYEGVESPSWGCDVCGGRQGEAGRNACATCDYDLCGSSPGWFRTRRLGHVGSCNYPSRNHGREPAARMNDHPNACNSPRHFQCPLTLTHVSAPPGTCQLAEADKAFQRERAALSETLELRVEQGIRTWFRAHTGQAAGLVSSLQRRLVTLYVIT